MGLSVAVKHRRAEQVSDWLPPIRLSCSLCRGASGKYDTAIVNIKSMRRKENSLCAASVCY